MSRHEGVSCDSCLKGNFRGKRYKCLICYDYDLCSTCYEAGATTTRHTTDHPVQCILTRTEFDLYYGGEALTAEQPQSFTCPYCGRMGLNETTLHDHVTADHADASTEVICPICASLPGGDPNHVTDDFASHLTLEHRTSREFDEPSGMRHVRRIPHPSRGVSGSRTRRANMHFASTGTALTGLSPSGRETMDPIAELLSQLSSVRNRAAAAQSVSSQLQQLEMQLQSTRHQLERLPRRQAEAVKATVASNVVNGNPEQAGTASASSNNSEFLLAKLGENVSEGDQQGVSREHLDKSIFLQELLLSTLTEQLQLPGSNDDPTAFLEALKSPSVEEEQQQGSKQASAESHKASTAASKTVPPNKQTEKVLTKLPAAVASQSMGSKSSSGPSMGAVWPVPNPHSAPNTVSGSGLSASNAGSGGSSSLMAYPPSGRLASPRDSRDGRMNPASAKRNMLKHMPPPKASDTEPPPH